MLIVRPLLALAVLAAAAVPARAQVTIDLHALDQLKSGKQAAPARPAHKQPKHTAEAPPRHKAAPKSEAEQHARPLAPAKAAESPAEPPPARAAAMPPPPAVLPDAAPPLVRLNPAEPEPAPAQTASQAKPDAPAVAADAGGAPEPIKEGVRITFDGNRSDLSPASEAGLKSFVSAAPKSGAASFNVLGFAAGAPEDPSTPRRLSLSRALAVRSVLMAEGIASTRIYVRALGGAPPDGPPDRVDVTVFGGTGP